METIETPTAMPAARATIGATDARSYFAGGKNIFHKELQEWFRTRRFLVTVVVATLIMVALPVGVWIVRYDGLTAGRATLPTGDAANARSDGAGTLFWLSSYLAIVLTAGMLVREREAGTAQWVFTKLVSRLSYGLAKWAANSFGVILATIVVPGVVSYGLLTAMYHVPGWSWADQVLAVGAIAIHAAVVVALMLALGAIFTSIVPVAATAVGLSVAPTFLAPLLDDGILRWYPVFRLDDLIAKAAGGQAIGRTDLAPLVAGLVFLVLCLAVAGYQLSRQELQ